MPGRAGSISLTPVTSQTPCSQAISPIRSQSGPGTATDSRASSANAAFAPRVVPAGERPRPARRRVAGDERLGEDDELRACAAASAVSVGELVDRRLAVEDRPARPGRTRPSRGLHGGDFSQAPGSATSSSSTTTSPSRAKRLDRVAVELGERRGAAATRRSVARVAGGTSPRTGPACARARSGAPAKGSRRERADAAARHAREADVAPRSNSACGALVVEANAGALLDAAHIDVHRQDRPAEREVARRRPRCRGRRRAAPSGRPASRARRGARRAVEVERPAVVAEPLPRADHVGGRRCGERLDGRPALEPGA